MKSFIVSYGYNILISIPIMMSMFIYFLGVHFSKNKWKAIHKSTQWSAVFYIIAVALLLKHLFTFSFLGYILIFLITLLSTILIIQWKKDTEVILLDGLRVMWRSSFLIFFILYLGLITYKLIQFYMAQ